MGNVRIIEHEGFIWSDAEVQRRARGAMDDPTHLVYDENRFFAELDAGRLEGHYSRVQIADERGVWYLFVVAPLGFTLIDEAIAAVQNRIVGTVPAEHIVLVQWQPGSIAKLRAARAARGETGNPYQTARQRVARMAQEDY